MAYTGPSVVDYLKNTGKDSSFAARKTLAEQMGIQGYSGSGSQNTQLLNSLRQLLTKPEPAPRTLPPPTQQAPGASAQGLPGSRNLPTESTEPPQEQQGQAPSYDKIFQDTVMAMLKAAQGAGDEDLEAKRKAIINARFNSSNQTTPEELQVLSPQAQSGIRNINSAGLEEQLGGVSAALASRQNKRQTQIETGEKLLKYLTPAEEKRSAEYIRWKEYVGAGGKLGLNEWTDAEDAKALSRSKAGASSVVINPVTGLSEQQTESLSTANNISNILNDPNFNSTFGLSSVVRRNVPGSPEYTLSNQVNQIVNLLALAARGKLKGQGSVSNFEAKMLKDAQTSLTLNTDPANARKELIKVRGALITSSGGEADVNVIDKNGQVVPGSLNSNDITQAIQQGYRVEYR